MSGVRTAVSWLVFPAILTVAIGGAIDALTRGYAAEAIVAVVGIDGLAAFPTGVLAQIRSPLRWERIEAASRAQAQRP